MSQAEVFYDSPNASLTLDDETKTLVLRWKQPTVGPERHPVLLKVIDYLRARQVKNLLIHIGELFALPEADERWGREVWAPQAEEAGLRFVALVQPRSPFIKSYYEGIKPPGSHVFMKYFDEVSDALTWFKQGQQS